MSTAPSIPQPTLADTFEEWVFGAFRTSPQTLAMCRILTGTYLLLLKSPGHLLDFSFLAQLPDAFFHPPPGLMSLFHGFPGPAFFDGIHLLLNLCGAALIFGYRTRLFSVLTTLALVGGFGFSYSLGKINHNFLFVVLPLVMAASNWGASYSFDALQTRTARQPVAYWPLSMMALLLGFAMFTAGAPKLASGWLDPTTHAVKHFFTQQFFIYERQDLLAPFFLHFTSSLFWESLDWFTVIFEVGFLAAAFHARLLRLFAGIAIFFHLGVLLMLNISFVDHMLIYALFVDWGKIQKRIFFPSQWRSTIKRTLQVIPGLPIVLSVGLLFYFFGSPLAYLLQRAAHASFAYVDDLLLLGSIALVIAFLWAHAIVRWIRALRPSDVADPGL